MTCRYWAERTAIQLFDTITLMSPQDLSTFLDALTSSNRRLSPHIRILHVQHDDTHTGPLWVHQVLLRLANRLPNLDHLTYADSAVRPKVHPHPLLPTRLPAFFCAFRSINELWLQDNHMQSFGDLMHLVGRLPQLRRLSCARITWTQQPGRMPTWRSHSGSLLSRIDFLNCRIAWAAVWLFVSPACISRTSTALAPILLLDANTAGAVTEVMRLFVGSDAKMESSTFSLEFEGNDTCALRLLILFWLTQFS